MKLRIAETPRGASLSIDIPNVRPGDDFIELLTPSQSPKELGTLLEHVFQGFKGGQNPELCEECVGGTYFLLDNYGRRSAVFKPLDEEPNAFNNPKGFNSTNVITRSRSWNDTDDTVSSSLSTSFVGLHGYKEGVMVGEASVRECAAFLLDHDSFASVPATDLVVAKHSGFHRSQYPPSISSSLSSSSEEEENDAVFDWFRPKLISSSDDDDDDQTPVEQPTDIKLGSFQEWRDHDGDFEEASRSMIAQFPTLQVQKVAVLDIRLFNTDRHGGNLLYKLGPTGRSSAILIPIDHGFTLPSTLDEALFVWLDWPQVKCPIEPEVKEYIKKLDVEADIRLLENKFPGSFGEEHFWVMRLAMLLLQKGAAANLTLYDIASMMCRLDVQEPSVLERLVDEARGKSGSAWPDIETVDVLLDQLLSKKPVN